MILELYMIFSLFALTFTIVGYWKEKPFLYTVGHTFLFLIGIVMMNLSLPVVGNSGIEYRTGSTITEAGGTQTITYTYDTYSNRLFGFLITLVAFALFIFTIINPKLRFQ